MTHAHSAGVEPRNRPGAKGAQDAAVSHLRREVLVDDLGMGPRQGHVAPHGTEICRVVEANPEIVFDAVEDVCCEVAIGVGLQAGVLRCKVVPKRGDDWRQDSRSRLASRACGLQLQQVVSVAVSTCK